MTTSDIATDRYKVSHQRTGGTGYDILNDTGRHMNTRGLSHREAHRLAKIMNITAPQGQRSVTP